MKQHKRGVNRSLWVIVLSVILSVSAYSLYVIARRLGVPPLIAIGMSTCFDGTALLAANYSVRYAEEGLSGAFPKTVVRVFALLAAYIQTFHAITHDGLSKSWILWASLPLAAMAVYEIHIRWSKRAALIAGGAAYAKPLPAFGLTAWVLNPGATFTAMREVVDRRRIAIRDHALEQSEIVTATDQLASVRAKRAARADSELTANRPEVKRPPNRTGSKRPVTVSGRRDAPVYHIREWAKRKGYELGDRGRIHKTIVAEYNQEMGIASG